MKELNWKRSITKFLTAQTISLFGSSLVQYAIIWYITLSTSSGKMLTISTLCGFVPQILISLFGGVWVDRYNRKKIIMLVDGAIAASTLALAISFIAGYQNMGILFAVLAIRSAGTGIQTPAVHSVIPQIVPKEHLMRVNGINSTLSSLMMFLSPAISGVILSIAPLEVTLLIDVITAVIGISITRTIFITPHINTRTHGNSAWEELKAGFRYLKRNQFIRNLLIFQVIILFSISPSAFLTPLLVSRTFGAQVWRLTAGEMTYSLGMVLGGLLITTWAGFAKKMHTTMLAGTLYGVFMIGLGTVPFFLLYLVCNTMIGVTSPCYSAPITVTIQEKIPQEMQGRVFSFMQIASSCALPLGMTVLGPLADVVSVQSILITAGIFVLLVVGVVWKSQWLQNENDQEVS